MSAPDTAAERDELRRQLDALRKRNEKLERVAEAARKATEYRNTSPVDTKGRYYVMARLPIDDLVDHLSALDKEDA